MSQKYFLERPMFFRGVSLIVGVLTMSVIISFAVLAAWTDAPANPPGNNVDKPLNIGLNDQIKSGGLSVGAFISKYGTILAKDSGNVGIGTTTPDPLAKLEVAGRIKVTGGSPGAGKVLTSDDENGLSSWQTVASSTDGCGSLSSPANSCYLSIDVDGDGKTPLTGDCDETCNTCFAGSTAGTDAPDGKDQDCDRQIDESSFVSCNEYYYNTGCNCSGGTTWSSGGHCGTVNCWTAVGCSSSCVLNGQVMTSWYCSNTGSCCDSVYKYY